MKTSTALRLVHPSTSVELPAGEVLQRLAPGLAADGLDAAERQALLDEAALLAPGLAASTPDPAFAAVVAQERPFPPRYQRVVDQLVNELRVVDMGEFPRFRCEAAKSGRTTTYTVYRLDWHLGEDGEPAGYDRVPVRDLTAREVRILRQSSEVYFTDAGVLANR